MISLLSANDTEEIRKKIYEALDPSNPYTLDDLNKELGNTSFAEPVASYKMDLKFENRSDNPDPEYATSGASGFDLRANIGETSWIITAHGIVSVPTGLYFEVPENFEIQIRPRSGLAAKHGVTVLNSPGTVDSDYRGEIRIILVNHGPEPFEIKHGDRIAQAVFASVYNKNIVNLKEVTKIVDDTKRSTAGFGSTGVK